MTRENDATGTGREDAIPGFGDRLRREPPTDEQLGYAAATFAYLVAALHLFHPSHGAIRLFEILAYGVGMDIFLFDPRPLLFVASGLGLIVGVGLVLAGAPRRPMYALGMALVVVYVVGYFGWHLTGHGGYLPGREPLYHGLAPHAAVIDHLATDTWAAAAKASETILFVLLGLLYVREGDRTG